ncbi:hypothetical protein C8R45DRAFT_840129 [Mycena sanguinolenta]|nr:hypothetical protein C8R45DRAFT_840129 [Mycena sanguinolenta]
MEEGEESEWGAEEGKKHVCPTCSKRFNRPSSLRIHVNTHTGATPFRCPHPSCGRAFNVNSNMRRHFRNHLGGSWLNTENNFNSPTSPSSLSFNTNPPAVVTSFPTSSSYLSVPSYLPSPALSSPPSASWSASSGSASSLTSPVTPSSATSSRGNRISSAFAPISGWGSEKPDREAKQYTYSPTGYLESDVRSDRPR